MTTTLTPADVSDPALVAFLLARIGEEAGAGRRRLAGSPRDADVLRRGLELLDELAADLRRGRAIDQMSVDLLVAAHGRHPEFRRRWDRFAA